MLTDPSDEAHKPNLTESVKIEWNWDFDDYWHELKSIGSGEHKHTFGEEGRLRLKGRCWKCWGGLIGKGGGNPVPTVIRCRVCGLLLEGDDARDEYERMQHQSSQNTLNIAFGFPTKYREDAKFVHKIFPYMDRQSEDEYRRRVDVASSKGSRKRWLTRSEFPAGSAGFLFLQARALMSGLERLPRELSVARFPDFEMHEDGSTIYFLPKDKLGEHSNTQQHELLKRLGSTMTVSMMSAFACELAMKAIRLTLLNEARKTHDLWQLYRDLPSESRARIEEDYPQVQSVLEDARYTFDKWRYFEANVGAHGMGAMIDTERAFALGKTARVLLDEAEMMGLGYSVSVDATRRVTKTGDRQDVHITHKMHTKGTELPPR